MEFHEVAIGLGLCGMVAESLPGFSGGRSVWYASAFQGRVRNRRADFRQQVESGKHCSKLLHAERDTELAESRQRPEPSEFRSDGRGG